MEKSFVISNDSMEFVWNTFHNSTMLQMCRQMLNTHLLNNGIEFIKGKGNKPMKVDAELEDLVDEKWLPFCAEAIDSILCFGFCPVSFEGGFPSILKLGSYRLKVTIKNNAYDWKVQGMLDPGKDLANCEVFDHYGMSPRMDGTLTSPVSKILPRLLFLKKLRETCIDMELRKANPHVFTEIKESNSTAHKEGVDYDFYADAGAAESRDDMQYSRNKSAVEMLNRQKELYEEYMGRGHAVKAMQNLNNVVQLPMGHHVVNPQMTSGRTDLVNLHKIIQEEICAVIGVPRSMMFADGGNHRSDKEGIHDSFMHTLLWYKKKLGIMLSDVYNTLYTETIMKSINFKKEKDRGRDVYELKRKHKVQVFFPVTPFVPNDQLRKLYEHGVISWDSFATYSLRNVSLPLSDKLAKAPPRDELLFEKPEPKADPKAKDPNQPKEPGEPDKKKRKVDVVEQN
jgi:hypothetical protein